MSVYNHSALILIQNKPFFLLRSSRPNPILILRYALLFRYLSCCTKKMCFLKVLMALRNGRHHGRHSDLIRNCIIFKSKIKLKNNCADKRKGPFNCIIYLYVNCYLKLDFHGLASSCATNKYHMRCKQIRHTWKRVNYDMQTMLERNYTNNYVEYIHDNIIIAFNFFLPEEK